MSPAAADAGVASRASREAIVLCINSGSSSLKFALFAMLGGTEQRLAAGGVARTAPQDGETARAFIEAKGHTLEREVPEGDERAGLDVAFALLDDARMPAPSAVGHRIVHGGARHVAPVRIDDELIASLRALVPLAPLHLPAAIDGIVAATVRLPGVVQVACFDTAFHATMPERARRLPLPDWLWDDGVRRYGFHGLSYEYIMSVLGPMAPRRIVIAHLGNGASLVAVEDGKSIDTTMGFTPTGGIAMGTRSGDLDPGVLFYLAREKRCTFDALEHLVNQEAGLLALGGTSDVKTLLARSEHDARARFAVEAFAYGVRKAIGALAAALGGMDMLVFTGGIGEKAAPIRAGVCHGLAVLGVALDERKNALGAEVISTPASRCTVRVIPTDEDLVIARHTHRLAAQSK